ncbi:MAG: hypothetical protein ACYDET_07430 [Thermoleophilia bacterium]
MIFDNANGKLFSVIILLVVAGGGYNLGRRMGLWTSRRRVFFFLWGSAAAPSLFAAINFGAQSGWVVVAVIFLLTMLTGGPVFALFGSIVFPADNRPKIKRN